ncbi:MAG TPA: UbiA family prenyltransferase, partial [Gammaproteobacteria bacterium]
TAGHMARRYLQMARLLPPLPLLLLLAPLLGAALLSSTGSPAIVPTLALMVATLALWGLAGCLNDLANARSGADDYSLMARGVLTQREVFWFALLLGVLALLIFALLGMRVLALASLPLLVALSYPWLRRRTFLIDAWLGVAIAWTVPLAYGAAHRWPDKHGALLGIVTLLWATGWWVLRAWPQQNEMMARGIRTLGLMFGPATGYLVIALQSAALLGAWMVGSQVHFGTPFSVSLAISAALLIGESLLLRKQASRAVPPALHLHLLGGVAIWLGVVLHFAH